MTTKTLTCLEVTCDECGDGWEDSDYGTPHFTTDDDLAKRLADYEWTVEGDEHYCRPCAAKRACAAAGGHQWTDWRGMTNYPDQWRDCDRDGCNAFEQRPVEEVSLP